MLIKTILLLLFISIGNADYYWRNYYGHIPNDAFPGGTDEGGEWTYIGLTYFPEENVILPTTIEEENEFAYAVIEDKLYKSNKNTKILCRPKNSRLKWAPTRAFEQNYITCGKIKGGFWNNTEVDIGRANVVGRTLIGAIINIPEISKYGLRVFDVNYKSINPLTYEILTEYC